MGFKTNDLLIFCCGVDMFCKGKEKGMHAIWLKYINLI